MPTISIITPVYDGGHQYLPDVYRSLVNQQMPPGWEWQWIVQEDGESGRPLGALPADDRISCGQGRRSGAATARTMALARAIGELTRPLDADDVLTDGALWRDIAVLTSNPALGWCVSAGLDLLSDGQQIAAPDDFPAGPMHPGVIYDHYEAGAHRVISCTLSAYTELIRAVGGWGALPASEDSSLLLACEAVASGWMISQPSMLYRKHAGQSTRSTAFHDETELAARQLSALQRAEALARTGWRWTPTTKLSPIAEAAV
ncbi:glycosyltransferase [Amycolatopsis minnesotensis]|uniref:Glycosyltransferase family 2 protein n=1 Tax=Amycolatopsis minnesotensis TaxID=337894 RepID=A0ABP5DRD0_9PSEU